jgi:hypothetical protein
MEDTTLRVIKLGVKYKVTCHYKEFHTVQVVKIRTSPIPERYVENETHSVMVPIDIYFKLLLDREDGFRVWIFSDKDIDQFTTVNDIFNNCGMFIDRLNGYYVDKDNYINFEFYRSVIAAVEYGTAESDPVKFSFGTAEDLGKRKNERLRHEVFVNDGKYALKYGSLTYSSFYKAYSAGQPLDAKVLKIKSKQYNEINPAATWNAYIDDKLDRIKKCAARAKKSSESIKDKAWEIIESCTKTYNENTFGNGKRITKDKMMSGSKKEAHACVCGVYVKYNSARNDITVTFRDISKTFSGEYMTDERVSDFLTPLVKVARMVGG